MRRLHRFDVLAAWYREYLTTKGYRPRTIRAYRYELAFFRRFVETETLCADIDDIGPEVLRQYVQSMYELQRSPSCIHHKSSALINFLGAIYEENKFYVDLRPKINLPRIGKRLPSAMLSEDEINQVFDFLESATDGLKVHALDDAVLLRDHAIVETLYGTGMRISELCALDRADVEYSRAVVTVRQGKGGQDRVVPLGSKAAAALAHYALEARGYFATTDAGDALFVSRFGGRLSSTAVREALKRILRGVGITRRVTVHGLRHSCATHMLNHGADIRFVQEQLGHACLSSTQIYTHVSIDKLRDTYRRCHPREREDEQDAVENAEKQAGKAEKEQKNGPAKGKCDQKPNERDEDHGNRACA